MGMPLFSGSAAIGIGSLVGHLVYDGVAGGMYGRPASAARRHHEPVAVHSRI